MVAFEGAGALPLNKPTFIAFDLANFGPSALRDVSLSLSVSQTLKCRFCFLETSNWVIIFQKKNVYSLMQMCKYQCQRNFWFLILIAFLKKKKKKYFLKKMV